MKMVCVCWAMPGIMFLVLLVNLSDCPPDHPKRLFPGSLKKEWADLPQIFTRGVFLANK